MSSENLSYISIYSTDVPEIIGELLKTPEMQRLSGIGMHCGCEYAGFQAYKKERHTYTRLIHSAGMSRIVWHFTRDIKQAVAGLLHDIAAPVFSHTIDFMNGDHMSQESTEGNTRAVIENSVSIMALLDKHRIKIEEVADYHKYPIADNDTPMLSADRLEYSLGNGYLLFNTELEQIQGMYDDLTVAENEYGIPELSFRSVDIAKAFAQMALRNSRFYVADEERFSMQYLAEIVRNAINLGVLTPEDLYTTENEVIEKLKNNKETFDSWDKYTGISAVSKSPGVLCDRYCVNVNAKKRYIDPLALTGDGAKRVSKIDPSIKDDIASFLETDFNYWLY